MTSPVAGATKSPRADGNMMYVAEQEECLWVLRARGVVITADADVTWTMH